jgi:hypothetical protein
MFAYKKKSDRSSRPPLILLLGITFAVNAMAGVPEEQVQRLSGDLTPVGAERGANEAGTIPAWTGGITEPPPSYTPGDHHPDPYAGESPLLSINAENVDQYAEFLGAGQLAMLKRYPAFRFEVYPTHRSVAYPQRVYEMSARNAVSGSLTEGGNGVVDVTEGFPFPFPASAEELMWNHQLRYRGKSNTRHINMMTPTTGGSYNTVTMTVTTSNLYYQEGATIDSIDNLLAKFTREITTPPQMAGNVLLVYESLNQVVQPRKVWIYNPGQRRVIRAPNVAYDSPSGGTDGMHVSDMTDMFNGALDRFDWELVGKKELYVPYNSYRIHSRDLANKDLVLAGHLEPDYLRYELHRVWVVEAKLRSGAHHINPRRTYYLDEDSYQILMVDHYDDSGDLWRYSEAHPINFYEVPAFTSTTEVHYDLQKGRYAVFRLDPDQPMPPFNVEMDANNFTPQSLRRRGRR